MKIGDLFLYLFVFVVGLRVVKSRDVICFFDEQIMGKQRWFRKVGICDFPRAVVSRAKASVCSSRLGKTQVHFQLMAAAETVATPGLSRCVLLSWLCCSLCAASHKYIQCGEPQKFLWLSFSSGSCFVKVKYRILGKSPFILSPSSFSWGPENSDARGGAESQITWDSDQGPAPSLVRLEKVGKEAQVWIQTCELGHTFSAMGEDREWICQATGEKERELGKVEGRCPVTSPLACLTANN